MNNLPAPVERPIGSMFTAEQIDLIKRTICPPGTTDDEFKMFLWDCQRSQLDPLARQIYLIERNEKYRDEQGNWRTRKKRSSQVAIDGFRLIAERTGEYAGQLGPEWCGPDGVWHDVWLSDDPPAGARVAALRKDFEKPLWTPVRFKEYAVTYDAKLAGQWAKMPAVMIAKCAEALALRRAFPRDLSGLYTTDEMMQASRGGDESRPSLADEMNDQIPDFVDAGSTAPPVGIADAARSAPGEAAAAAHSQPAAAVKLTLEEMAIEAAKRGPEPLHTFFENRSASEKIFLRKKFGEKGEKLKVFYPQQPEG